VLCPSLLNCLPYHVAFDPFFFFVLPTVVSFFSPVEDSFDFLTQPSCLSKLPCPHFPVKLFHTIRLFFLEAGARVPPIDFPFPPTEHQIPLFRLPCLVATLLVHPVFLRCHFLGSNLFTVVLLPRTLSPQCLVPLMAIFRRISRRLVPTPPRDFPFSGGFLHPFVALCCFDTRSPQFQPSGLPSLLSLPIVSTPLAQRT